MEFKKFTAGSNAYGTDEKGDKYPSVNFKDADFDKVLNGPSDNPRREELLNALLFLALCHTIIVDEHGKYSAASPDELALVNMAKKYGLEFEKTDKEGYIIINDTTSGKKVVRKFLRMHVCEFSSDRKRMSVVVKDEGG